MSTAKNLKVDYNLSTAKGSVVWPPLHNFFKQHDPGYYDLEINSLPSQKVEIRMEYDETNK